MGRLAASVAALCLSATPALGQTGPAHDMPLVPLGSSDTVIYLAQETPTGPGTAREVWVFIAEKKPVPVGTEIAIGLWLHERLDCRANTVSDLRAIALRQDFTVADDSRLDPTPQAIKPGTAMALVFRHACEGARPAGATVAGPRQASQVALGMSASEARRTT